MFKQTLYMLVRRYSKDSMFSFINLINLIVGFATFILLSQYISAMLSFDKHNVNYDRIYRVQLFQDQPENRVKHSSSITAALSRHDLVGLPEIEQIVLFHDVGDNNKNGVFLSVDKKTQFLTRYGYYADQSVFDVLTFRFLEGSSQYALTQPYSIVLSKSLADKLFPAGKAIGQNVYGENKSVLTVTGIYEDIPVRSSWRPTYLLPMNTFTATTGWADFEDNYRAYSFGTYVLLKKNADPANVDSKINNALKDYRKEHFPYLRPMSKLYLNPFYEPDMLIALALDSFIGILIQLLASMNFINLQTANATSRFREIGIMKTVGFSKKQLWKQFMSESIIMACIGGILGLMLAQLVLPAFNKWIGIDLLTNIFTDWKLICIILAVTILAGFISGIHPAYVISSFNPVATLKQKFVDSKTTGISLKKILVTGQFSISLFLLIVSAIIYRQTHYMNNRDMGFESHNLLFANIVTDKKASFDVLRQKLISYPEIVNACQSDYIPFILPGGNELSWEGVNPEEKVFIRISNVSYDFVPTFDLNISAGRNFSREYPSDADKCLVNETAVRVFGWEDPVGKHVRLNNKDMEVLGVISDYVVFSVHNPLEPHLYRLVSDETKSDRVYSIRFKPGMEKTAMQIVQQEFEQFFAGDAFEFKNIRSRIQNENAMLAWKSFMRVCAFLALLSIVISSVGLFGLILLYSRRKLKEIGIRKVLGFSFFNLYVIMSSGFLKLLLFAILIAWPCAFYIYKILPGANKYQIQAWEFIIATLIIFIVALATISYQIIKAVKVRPVEVLKDE